MAERIIVHITEGSKLNSAIKAWKQKSKYITEELRERKQYEKPSVRNRAKKLKAIHKQRFLRGED